jgi:hypothetical protein
LAKKPATWQSDLSLSAQKRTSGEWLGMSAKCQEPTYALQQIRRNLMPRSKIAEARRQMLAVRNRRHQPQWS